MYHSFGSGISHFSKDTEILFQCNFYPSVQIFFFFVNQQDKKKCWSPQDVNKNGILVFQSALAAAWYQFWGRCSYSFKTLLGGNNFTLERHSSHSICACVEVLWRLLWCTDHQKPFSTLAMMTTQSIDLCWPVLMLSCCPGGLVNCEKKFYCHCLKKKKKGNKLAYCYDSPAVYQFTTWDCKVTSKLWFLVIIKSRSIIPALKHSGCLHRPITVETAETNPLFMQDSNVKILG